MGGQQNSQQQRKGSATVSCYLKKMNCKEDLGNAASSKEDTSCNEGHKHTSSKEVIKGKVGSNAVISCAKQKCFCLSHVCDYACVCTTISSGT